MFEKHPGPCQDFAGLNLIPQPLFSYRLHVFTQLDRLAPKVWSVKEPQFVWSLYLKADWLLNWGQKHLAIWKSALFAAIDKHFWWSCRTAHSHWNPSISDMRYIPLGRWYTGSQCSCSAHTSPTSHFPPSMSCIVECSCAGRLSPLCSRRTALWSPYPRKTQSVQKIHQELQ